MPSSHLTALLLPQAASLPRAGLAILQGLTTPQSAPLPAASSSRQPRPSSIPGSPEHERRSHPRDCSAPPRQLSSRSRHECEQFALPKDATDRQWRPRRQLQYCGSCGVEFYNPRRRHSSIGYLSPIDYEHRHRNPASPLTHTSLPSCSQPSRPSPAGGPEDGAGLDRRCARRPHPRAGRDERMAPPGAKLKNCWLSYREGQMPPDQTP